MKPSKRFSPRLESLESVVVMSISAAVMPHAAAFAARAHAHPRIALSGQVTGTVQTVPSNPDAGKEQGLIGAGTVAPLGPTQASAILSAPGFIASGRTTGTLTLTGLKGSLTLALKSPVEKGFSAIAANYSFTITGGTGIYTHAVGRGTAFLHEIGNHFTLTIRH